MMWKYRAIAAVVFVGMFAIPAAVVFATEAPGGVPHTTEWHGKYEGCKWTHGWARRTWDLMDHTLPGPQPDPNYSYPGRDGKMYDFRCQTPPKGGTSTVTVTKTATATATITQAGATVTVTAPGPTVTQTVTVTATPTESPCVDPDVNGDENSNDHNGLGDDVQDGPPHCES